MNNQRPRWYRRQYLVNPGFQLRFMFYVASAVLLGFAAIYVTNLWYLDTLVAQGEELGLNPQHVYFEYIAEQRRMMNTAFLVVLTVVFALLMVGGLLLSHKIAGPIYRIERYTNDLLAGNASPHPVRLRKGDFFPEIETIVNGLISHYRDDDTADATPAESPAKTASFDSTPPAP